MGICISTPKMVQSTAGGAPYDRSGAGGEVRRRRAVRGQPSAGGGEAAESAGPGGPLGGRRPAEHNEALHWK